MLPSLLLMAIVASTDLSTPAAAAHAFVERLPSDALHHFESLPVDPADWTEWVNVRDLFDRFDDIVVGSASIESVEVTGDDATALLRIDGTAVTSGLRRPRALPDRWLLQLSRVNGQWKIRAPLMYERHLARRLAAMPNDDERWRFVESSDAVLPRLARELADDTTVAKYGSRAREIAAFATELARRHGTQADVAFCLRVMSSVSTHHQNPADGVRFANEALQVARAADDPDGMAGALFSMGIARWFENDHDDAVQWLGQSTAMIDRLEDPTRALKALHMQNFIEIRREGLRAALVGGERLVELSRQYGWTEGEYVALMTLADVTSRFGEPESAYRLYERALEVVKPLHHRVYSAFALTNMGASAAEAGRHEDAIALYHRALETGGTSMTAGDRAAVIGNMAARLYALGRYEESGRRAEEAIRLTTETSSAPNKRGGAMMTLARVRLALGRTEEAVQLLREADALEQQDERERTTTGQTTWWHTKTLLGETLRATCRTEGVEQAFLDAITLLEDSRAALPDGVTAKSSFLSGKTAPYHGLIDLYVETGRTLEALEVAQRLKARTLRDVVVEQGRVTVSAAMLAEEQEREAELDGKLVKLNRARLAAKPEQRAAIEEQLQAAREELAVFLASIYAKYGTARARRLDPAERIDNAAEAVFAGATSVVADFVVTEADTFLFVLRRGDARVRVHRLGIGRKLLTERVARYETALERRDLRHGKLASELYATLLGFLDADIAAGKTIGIVPDGELWRVPFDALRRGDGRYAGDLATLHYAPSITLMAPQSDRDDDRAPAVLAIGNPVVEGQTMSSVRALYRNLELGDLPEAAEEARAISKLYPRATTLTREQAVEGAVKDAAARYSVLHFATHALADDRAPMFSALVLGVKGNESREDGLLEAREIANMKLNADLAVLSACDTAAGAIFAGEGVVGLSWAFMAAGCPTTVASRWKASSQGTAVLMVAFHRELRNGRTAAEALRRAQRTLRSDSRYSHPFYWAAFSVIGAP